MRNTLKYLILVLLVTSCSASWHLRRAISKDPTIVKTNTVEITKIIRDKGAAYVVKGRDTLIQDSLVSINLQYDSTGHVKVRWELKDIKVRETLKYVTITTPKSNFQVWQENRTKRVEVRQYNKTKRTEVKQVSKIERHKGVATWRYYLAIALIPIMFVFGYMLHRWIVK
jgi:hypothetical protein